MYQFKSQDWEIHPIPEGWSYDLPDYDRWPSKFGTIDSTGKVTWMTDKPEAINPKDLIGGKKPDVSLVPAAGILLEAQAMMDGAAKYGAYNWRENPVLMRVYISAAMRHLQQLLDREDIDPTSDVYHIGHARACLGILADALFTGNLKDDRPLPGPAGEMIRRFYDTQSFKPTDNPL